MHIQMAIATKKPEDMNEEELSAYKEWKAWYDQNKERLDREEKERKEKREQIRLQIEEERKRASEQAAEYRRKVREQEKWERENAGTLDWFIAKVRYTRKPYEAIRIDKTPEDTEKFLLAAYEAEVVRRGASMQLDINTGAVITAVSRWLTSHVKPGLMLRGYIGVGKTTMMYAISSLFRFLSEREMVIVDARKIAELGKTGSPDFDKLAKCSMLGIDDLGTEPLVVKNYGNDISPIVELLSERYNYRRFTVITTNLTKKTVDGTEVDELLEIYGDRTYDRIRELFNSITYDGMQKSYRI